MNRSDYTGASNPINTNNSNSKQYTTTQICLFQLIHRSLLPNRVEPVDMGRYFPCYFILSSTKDRKENEKLDARSETNNFDASSLSERKLFGWGAPPPLPALPVWLLFPLGRKGCKYLLVRTGKRRKRKRGNKRRTKGTCIKDEWS